MDQSNKIIDRIKSENIQPRSRLSHVFRASTIWLICIMALIFGALAFSIILLAVQQADFSIISHMSHSKLELLLGLVPIIWLVSIVIFLIPVMWSIRSSWKGYKFSLFFMLGIYLLGSMTLGTLFFITGGSERLERAFDIHFTKYESIEERKKQVWSRPESGFLSGIIQSTSEVSIELIDFDGKQWRVTFPDAFIAPVVMLEKDERIKLIGTKLNSDQFEATEIRPWGGRQGLGGPGQRRMQK